MKKLCLSIIIFFSITCKAQDNSIVILKHSPSDTAFSIEKKEYTLYTYLKNNFPTNCGTEFWLIPKNRDDRFQLKANNSTTIGHLNEIKICVIPREDFKLSVIKNDTIVDEFEFNSIELSKPLISTYTSLGKIKNNKINNKSDSLFVKIEQPDNIYQRIYPKDCRYISDSTSIIVMRGNQMIASINLKKEIFSLKGLQLQKGDRIIIKVSNIKRANFLNKLYPIEGEFEKEIEIE